MALDRLEVAVGAMAAVWWRLGDVAIRADEEGDPRDLSPVGALLAAIRRVELDLDEARTDLEPARDELDDDQGDEPGRVLS
jgi:hypothetical protein